MDENKILNDDNLDKLDLIKHINIYSIVDKEIERKRERMKIWSLVGTFLFLLSFAIILGIATVIFKRKFVLLALISYYVFSVWGMILLMIPIIKRKRVY